MEKRFKEWNHKEMNYYTRDERRQMLQQTQDTQRSLFETNEIMEQPRLQQRYFVEHITNTQQGEELQLLLIRSHCKNGDAWQLFLFLLKWLPFGEELQPDTRRRTTPTSWLSSWYKIKTQWRGLQHEKQQQEAKQNKIKNDKKNQTNLIAFALLKSNRSHCLVIPPPV